MKQFREEAIEFYTKNPKYFKKPLSKVTKEEFMEKVESQARFRYQLQKNKIENLRQYKKAYAEAVALVGKERLDAGIALVKTFESKTYYFIDNVMLYKGYQSDTVIIDVVTDEFRASFKWEKWFSTPFAEALGMTADDKNLFIC